MRVFITGIDGFVGRHLARRLAAAGHVVLGSTLHADSDVDGAERIVRCDIRQAGRVAGAVREAAPDTVVHLAGQTSVAASFRRPSHTFRVNVHGALNVLEACRAAGIGQVILITSCEVYGVRDAAQGLIAESAPLAPVSPYGSSKAAQDILGYQYWRGLGVPVVRVRAFPHTGPGQTARFLFPRVARQIALAEQECGPQVIPVGNVDVIRDLLDVRDVVEGYAALIESEAEGDVFNLCSGEGRSLRSALEVLCGQARHTVRLETDPSRLRPADFEWMVGDPGKLTQTTGWRPRRAWEDTMRDLLTEWRERVAVEAVEKQIQGRTSG